ncbi:uncharacterized protein LOC113351192 [Papaver somniferum]|uniref:uncharacterized protein LOC113351192 n=1 Tax=Papaver somniferum TaxID=3469 RepID=UPI000E7048B0|nr:uncharacterized protein LOC113351192 [Papaver somniferum]
MVMATKERGVLGVLNLRLINQVLLAKWCWRFGIEKSHLWYKLIEEKWIGESCFMNSFKSLYKLGRLQNASIVEHIIDDGSWKFDFKICLTNEESTLLWTLLHIIGSNPPTFDALTYTRRWPLTTSGTFSIKSLYANMISNAGDDNYPYKFVWLSGIPPKVNFLLWCAVHGKLNSQDMMQIKGIDIYSSCILCGDCTESQDLIFIHCKVAHKIWCSITPNDRWAWVFPDSMINLARIWFHNHLSPTGKIVWNLILGAIVWVLWRERNCRTFEEKYTFKTDEELCNEVKALVLT